MRLIQSLASKELVRNLPKLKFDQHFCDACKIRKQAHASHKAKNIVSTTRCLELLHIDLFGPSAIRSYGGNRYTLVIVDDYSREFDNEVQFGEFCKANGNAHNFLAPHTPQSNGVVEKPKNVNEALVDESWIVAMQEELNQFIANDVWELVPQPRNMTIIETKWVFRNKLDENVARLESIRILLAYACALDFKLFQMDVKSAFLNGFINEEVYVAQPPGFIDFEKPDHDYKLKKAIYGLKQAPKAWKIEESLNVTFNETPPPFKTTPLVDDDLDEEEAIKVTKKKNLENDIEDESLEIDEIVNIKESRNHPLENVIENLNQRTLRPQAQNQIPQPRNMTIIGTKWVFRNKLDENGIVSRNKPRLVAQGYNQQEGIDYDGTYAPVARLESIRILLAYACALDFKLFQMDVKSAFLNGFINEEVYMAQPSGFIDFEKPDHVLN
ncbi:retrovirus-related pol polyprotein from transposon TNT 1-94 [Tanacetum coccineum]